MANSGNSFGGHNAPHRIPNQPNIRLPRTTGDGTPGMNGLPDSSPFLIHAVVATFAGKQDGDAHELNSDPNLLPLGISSLVQCFDLQFISVLDVIDNRVGRRRDIASLNRIDQSDMIAE